MATKKNIILGKSGIINAYSDYCLTHGKKPVSVYKFAKDNGIEESYFYQFFPSFEVLEQQYFTEMFHHTIETLENLLHILRIRVLKRYQHFISPFLN